MGVLFKQKMSELLGQGLNKKEARNKVLSWFINTSTCRCCDCTIKPSEFSWKDRTYCNDCMSQSICHSVAPTWVRHPVAVDKSMWAGPTHRGTKPNPKVKVSFRGEGYKTKKGILSITLQCLIQTQIPDKNFLVP